jgi:hypothetical protein
VTGELHRDTFWYARAPDVAHRGSTKVVRNSTGQPAARQAVAHALVSD